MDERRPGESGAHLTIEQVGQAADGLEPIGGAERAHLDLCAVCRTEVARTRSLCGMLGELGERYRGEAPPEWPALSAVEARAREADRRGLWARLHELLGARVRPAAAALAAGLVVLVVAAVALVLAPRPAGEPGGRAPVVAGGPDVPVAVPGFPDVAPGPAPAPEATVVAAPSETGPAAPPGPAPGPVASSSVVAVAAAPDVSYVMMSVPYEGGTADVLWLSALPASAQQGVAKLPL